MITDDTKLTPLILTHRERMDLVEAIEIARETKERRARNEASVSLADMAVRMEEAHQITTEQFNIIAVSREFTSTVYLKLMDLTEDPVTKKINDATPTLERKPVILDANEDFAAGSSFNSFRTETNGH